MEKNTKQKTIYNIYNIETKETKEVSNWRGWAAEEGIPTNSLTLFKRMVNDPQRTFYKKYILKDNSFEERLKHAGKVKPPTPRTQEARNEASLNQRKDYLKNKIFVNIDTKEEFNSNDILNFKEFAEKHKLDSVSFKLMLRNGEEGGRVIKTCGPFTLKENFKETSKTEYKPLLPPSNKGSKMSEEAKANMSFLSRQKEWNNLKVTNLTTGVSVCVKDHTIYKVAEILNMSYSTLVFFLNEKSMERNIKGVSFKKEYIDTSLVEPMAESQDVSIINIETEEKITLVTKEDRIAFCKANNVQAKSLIDFIEYRILILGKKFILESKWIKQKKEKEEIEKRKLAEFEIQFFDKKFSLKDAFFIDALKYENLNLKKGIYAFVHIPTKKYYIGSTNSFLVRWNNHITELKLTKHANSHLQNSWLKYKEDEFAFFILEEIQKDEDLLKEEQRYLDRYVKNTSGDITFNLAEVAGVPDRKAIISKEVNQINLETGEVIQSFESPTEAAKILGKFTADGIPLASNIVLVCEGKGANAFGFGWEYKDEELKSLYPKFEPKQRKGLKRVQKMDSNGNVLETYASIAEAASKEKINSSSISIACNHKKYNKTKGIVFRFEI